MVADKGHTDRACTSRETMHGPRNHARAELARAEKRCTGGGTRRVTRAKLVRAEKRCTGRGTYIIYSAIIVIDDPMDGGIAE